VFRLLLRNTHLHPIPCLNPHLIPCLNPYYNPYLSHILHNHTHPCHTSFLFEFHSMHHRIMSKILLTIPPVDSHLPKFDFPKFDGENPRL